MVTFSEIITMQLALEFHLKLLLYQMHCYCCFYSKFVIVLLVVNFDGWKSYLCHLAIFIGTEQLVVGVLSCHFWFLHFHFQDFKCFNLLRHSMPLNFLSLFLDSLIFEVPSDFLFLIFEAEKDLQVFSQLY
jgi:hypothetical protein